MITRLSVYDFREMFKSADRDQFSYEGYQVLFDYLEDIDEDYELDVIGVCCDFTEYANVRELVRSYPGQHTLDNLRDKTTVLEIGNGGYIVQEL